MTTIYDATNAPTREQILAQARRPVAKTTTSTQPVTRTQTSSRPAVRVPGADLEKVEKALRQGYTVEDLAQQAGIGATELRKAIYRRTIETTRTLPYAGGRS